MSRGIVSPETLLDQLREELELVAATSQTQLSWCESHRMPVDEIHQWFRQVAFTHRPRIREAGLLSAHADVAIDELLAQFDSMWAESQSLSRNGRTVWQPEGLDGPEWKAARMKAQLALDML